MNGSRADSDQQCHVVGIESLASFHDQWSCRTAGTGGTLGGRGGGQQRGQSCAFLAYAAIAQQNHSLG